MSEFTKFYPDIVAAGNLATALQAAIDDISSLLHVSDLSLALQAESRPTTLPFAYARVEAGRRFSQLFIAEKERLFICDFWGLGVELAHGATINIVDIARAIDMWLTTNVSSSELKTAFSFVHPEKAASFFEAGGEVEWKWRCLDESIANHLPELVSFFEIAKNTQVLRMLFPYTSLNMFCFSRCTGYPYSNDCPCVIPVFTDKGSVAKPSRYKVCLRQINLGEGDANEAAQLVLRNLPKDIGPAVPGTADDLKGGV